MTDSGRLSQPVCCSLCGTRILNQENLTVDSEGDHFCEECVVDLNCSQCKKQLRLTKTRKAELGDNIICRECSADEGDSNSTGQSSSRRRFLVGSTGLLAVSGVAKAVREGYFAGVLGQREPDYEETQKLNLDDKQYYAERFEAPAGATLEYELNIVSGGIESKLYTEPEYQKFKQGIEEENRYDRGTTIEECSTGVGAGDREFSCELPAEGMYSLVFIPFVSEDNQGVLTYRVYS